MRGSLFALILASVFVSSAQAANLPEQQHSTGWAKVAEDRYVYFDYLKPLPGRPVVALINGLTYKTQSWDAFVEGLRGQGLGILRWDLMGQGQTLLRYAPARGPFQVNDQVNDMRRLFVTLGIRQPVHLIGLSYGGAIAAIYGARFPKHTASIISMAPFTEPLEFQDKWIRAQIKLTRLTFPANPATDDQLYDFFLRNIVYTTYPTAEPVVLENPYKLEATFRLVQGIRKFRFVEIVDLLPPGKFHLVIAGRDQYIKPHVLEKNWNSIPVKARASRVIIRESEHKIPEDVPRFSAAVSRLIIMGHPAFSQGRSIDAIPSKGEVRIGQQVIIKDLPRE